MPMVGEVADGGGPPWCEPSSNPCIDSTGRASYPVSQSKRGL